MNKHSRSVLTLALLLAGACDKVPEPQAEPRRPPAAKPSSAPEPTELVKEDLKLGEGSREVKSGDEIRVNYVGKLLKNGSVFDSNKSKEDPFTFTVGQGVIEGWSQGVIGMRKGGKRKLTIPGHLAYGEAGSPPKIPGNATLVFEIDLLGWDGEAEATATASASAAPSASAQASVRASSAPAVSATPSAKAPATPTAKPGGPAPTIKPIE